MLATAEAMIVFVALWGHNKLGCWRKVEGTPRSMRWIVGAAFEKGAGDYPLCTNTLTRNEIAVNAGTPVQIIRIVFGVDTNSRFEILHAPVRESGGQSAQPGRFTSDLLELVVLLVCFCQRHIGTRTDLNLSNLSTMAAVNQTVHPVTTDAALLRRAAVTLRNSVDIRDR